MGTQQSVELETDQTPDGEDQILSRHQKQTLRCSWRHMSKGGQSNCGATIMRRLLLKDENLKAVFQTSALIREADVHHDMAKHREDLVQLLQFVITNLEVPSQISEMCMQIGRDHQKYKRTGLKVCEKHFFKSNENKFHIDHWDQLGEAITETIREYEGWKKHRESLRAANMLVSFMIDRMRTGFTRVEGKEGLMRSRSARDNSRHLAENADGEKRKLERNSSCPIRRDRKSVEERNKPRRFLPIPPEQY